MTPDRRGEDSTKKKQLGPGRNVVIWNVFQSGFDGVYFGQKKTTLQLKWTFRRGRDVWTVAVRVITTTELSVKVSLMSDRENQVEKKKSQYVK